MNKLYLGDSVYASFDGLAVILTTETDSPDGPSNEIFLEPEVQIALVSYIERLGKK